MFLDLATLKTSLGVAAADTTKDPQITFAAEVCTALIQEMTGRKLIRNTYRDKFIHPGGMLDLMEFPVERINSITPNIPGAWELEHATGTINIHGCYREHEVIVEYVAGYDPLPPIIIGIYFEMVRRQLSSMNVDLAAAAVSADPVKAVTVGTLRVEYAVKASADGSSGSSSPLVKAVLDQYSTILGMYMHPRMLAATP